ncbi:MAG: family 20 glycosylhydrolase [Opitutaceae bacterium]|nr:family 20 glycosylhydrolase [Opitutaceae bacterium]
MIKAFQWDLARQVERPDYLAKLLPRYAAWGYEELYLHLEDAVEYPSLPGVARSDAFSHRQFGRLVEKAADAGISTVPIVNLLGHTQYLLNHPSLRDLNELRAADGTALAHGQICPLHPRTLEIAEILLRDIAPFCTASKVHVGLDESFHLGKCPRCRAEIARVGLAAHFARHVQRLHGLCRRLGLRLGLWADMLYFVPEAIPLLPRDVTVYDWYYYPFARLPRVELFNFAERDLATPLRRQGIAYYGCPMNSGFRHEPLPVFGERLANLSSWWRRCREAEAEGFLVTSWEPNRCGHEMTTIVDAAAADLWLEPCTDDATAMLTRGIERVFGSRHAREAARTLLAGDERAFAGYARWQINDRWDVFAGTEGVAPYEREERYFSRAHARSHQAKWPPPITASLAFRRYLAARDVFVRRAARGVFRLRRHLAREEKFAHYVTKLREEAADFARALAAGRRAARALWRRTRNPQVRGQNEQLVDLDARRLRKWRLWLRRATLNPSIVWNRTPVCGSWQLQFMVHNFAPAVQKVVVEQQQADGTWQELAGRFTIEFRARAACPRWKGKHEFTVPIRMGSGRSRPSKESGAAAAPPAARLRIAVRGVGQVAISHVTLTDGVALRRPGDWRPTQRKILGDPAPCAGLPSFNTGQNSGAVKLAFC